jgi:tetratricopeptide (TPR) repeat protein
MRPAPAPTPIFVGRDRELGRLQQRLGQLSVAVVYGVAGVGKSSLASKLVGLVGKTTVYTRAGAGQPLETLLDDVRRELAGGRVAEAESLEARLADTAQRLDQTGALWWLDDLHHLEADRRAWLIDGLALHLRQGRLVCTSRERVPPAPGGPDRFELRLEGLEPDDARSLWLALDDLYGATGGFEATWQRAHGNPFFLRRAHAGDLDAADPVAAAVAGLEPDAERLAHLLALSTFGLPRQALERVLPPPAGILALRQLVTALVADVDGSGMVALHDLFREALRARLQPDQERQLRRQLIDMLNQSSLAPVVRVREVLAHLLALGEHTEAFELLAAHGAELIRHGAAGELLRGLDALPDSVGMQALRVARARVLARLLDLRRAHDELTGLLASSVEPPPELLLAHAQVAMFALDLGRSQQELSRVLARSDLSAELRLRATCFAALVLAYLGRRDETRAQLAAALAGAHSTLEGLVVRVYQSFIDILDGEDESARLALEGLRALEGAGSSSFRLAVIGRGIGAIPLARLGRIQEAEESLAQAEANLVFSEDLRGRLELRTGRAFVLMEKGERREAAAELRQVAQALERGGYRLNLVFVRAWLGRALLLLGRRVEALRLLEQAEAEARGGGAQGLVRLVETVRASDVLAELVQGPGPGSTAPRRLKLLEALQLARQGDASRVELVLGQAGPASDRPDEAVERALAHLAYAVLAWLDSRTADAEREQKRAQDELSRGGCDPGLAEAMIERLGRVRAIGPGLRELHVGEPPQVAASRLVLDGRSHELRWGSQRLSLTNHRTVRQVLYGLAEQVGRPVSRDRLAELLWNAPYHPGAHDNALKVNLTRLRTLLRKTPLGLELLDPGYRLVAPDDFVFVDVLPSPGG